MSWENIEGQGPDAKKQQAEIREKQAELSKAYARCLIPMTGRRF